MKVLLLNGSPRRGNTCTALEAVKRGAAEVPDLELAQIDAGEVSVSPCIACETCGCEGDCVFDDDTNDVIDAIAEADTLVFASPVYWWGITAQLKAIVDKMYSKCGSLEGTGKKVCLITIGEAATEEPQYELIRRQFECICEYLGWELVFSGAYSAAAPDELAKDSKAVEQLEELGRSFK